MWWLFACAAPDPDALLRAGDIDAAAAAWNGAHVAQVDLDHEVANLLARREPDVTVPRVAEAVDVVRLVEAGPVRSRLELNSPVASIAGVLAGARAAARLPLVVAVGRSDARADVDVLQRGAALPWLGSSEPGMATARGRLVGWTRYAAPSGAGTATDVWTSRRGTQDLGAWLDANPPARLVTLAFEDATGAAWIWAERHAGEGWTLIATSSYGAADRMLRGAPTGEGLRPEVPPGGDRLPSGEALRRGAGPPPSQEPHAREAIP
jgi:hypothetical protein